MRENLICFEEGHSHNMLYTRKKVNLIELLAEVISNNYRREICICKPNFFLCSRNTSSEGLSSCWDVISFCLKPWLVWMNDHISSIFFLSLDTVFCISLNELGTRWKERYDPLITWLLNLYSFRSSHAESVFID